MSQPADSGRPADGDDSGSEAGSTLLSTPVDVPVEGSVPLRSGGPCPRCGGEIEDLDFLELPSVAIKRDMYDVCVIDTDELPTPWRHPTAVAYHEDTDPGSDAGRGGEPRLASRE